MHVTLLLAELSSHASAALALEMLDAANRFATPSKPFNVCVASLTGQPVSNALGRAMAVDSPLDAIEHTDLILIPGFLFTLRDASPSFGAYCNWLRYQHEKGAVVASMCTATFMLAEAGLLNGIQATTHWAFAAHFRRLYPSLSLDAGRILSEDGRVITSAGASSALDLMLHLIRRFASRDIAQQCSSYLLVDGIRSEQSVYITWSMPRGHNDKAVLDAQEWMEANFSTRCGIDEIAQRFGFGIRNFKRRFKEATGSTPTEYLQIARLEKAKLLLETTRLGFEVITEEVGYENSNSFRRLFTQRVGISPTAFRKKFTHMPSTSS
ncbi:GlxA family transcriptional regulator [Pseudomonas monteilii]|uniref:GlxA family transcriptional regulator n=1 Tax=Pseudomonas monteilii TaxID=76759 RepID=UPI0037F1FC12